MPFSQNGWLGYADYGDPALTPNPTIPGTNVQVLGGLNTIAAPVLLWVGAQFNRTVEPVSQDLGCWGYEPRVIRGSTELSNHASGTAIDLNSALHPLGAVGTFTGSQVTAIRQILDACGGLVRWGGDYNGRKDEMHFEVTGSSAQIALLGGRLVGVTVAQQAANPPPAVVPYVAQLLSR